MQLLDPKKAQEELSRNKASGFILLLLLIQVLYCRHLLVLQFIRPIHRNERSRNSLQALAGTLYPNTPCPFYPRSLSPRQANLRPFLNTTPRRSFPSGRWDGKASPVHSKEAVWADKGPNPGCGQQGLSPGETGLCHLPAM